jgi:hypothetical protein
VYRGRTNSVQRGHLRHADEPFVKMLSDAQQACAHVKRALALYGDAGRARAWARQGSDLTREGNAGRECGKGTREGSGGGGEVTGGPYSGLGTIADSDVGEDAREVRFHGALSDAESVSDDAVWHAFAHIPEYFELA